MVLHGVAAAAASGLGRDVVAVKQELLGKISVVLASAAANAIQPHRRPPPRHEAAPALQLLQAERFCAELLEDAQFSSTPTKPNLCWASRKVLASHRPELSLAQWRPLRSLNFSLSKSEGFSVGSRCWCTVLPLLRNSVFGTFCGSRGTVDIGVVEGHVRTGAGPQIQRLD